MKKAGVTLQAHSGDLVSSGAPEALEGNWLPKRSMLVKFESLEKLKSC